MPVLRCSGIKRNGERCNYRPRFRYFCCRIHRSQEPRSYDEIVMEYLQILNIDENEFFEQLAIQRKIFKDINLEKYMKTLKSDNLVENDCCICIDKPDELVLSECCKKEFCYSCLKTWFNTKPSCPACRFEIEELI